MKEGYLSKYFSSIAVKKLSVVEADVCCSNQHEFNGVKELKGLFGKPQGKTFFDAKFIYMDDGEDEVVTSEGRLTWYDARENHPSRSEYRLYFPTTEVSKCAKINDTLFIGLRPDKTVLVIIAENGSTIESQIRWLFGVVEKDNKNYIVRDNFDTYKDKIKYTSTLILERLGIEVESTSISNYTEEMLHKFKNNFPSTRDFSEYSRSKVMECNPIEDPDETLMLWIEREEELFRALEKKFIENKLKQGFVKDNGADVDEFIRFSLSVQNRRKSRVGFALENHMEEIFKLNKILYNRNPITENKTKPDFLFPNIDAYINIKYPTAYLTMLGVKSTCKDRWRQVLDEADRIEQKHLLTLEAAISENQTNAMHDRKLQLILPQKIHETYNNKQREWLWNIKDFIVEVKERQKFYMNLV